MSILYPPLPWKVGGLVDRALASSKLAFPASSDGKIESKARPRFAYHDLRSSRRYSSFVSSVGGSIFACVENLVVALLVSLLAAELPGLGEKSCGKELRSSRYFLSAAKKLLPRSVVSVLLLSLKGESLPSVFVSKTELVSFHCFL